MAAKNAFTSTAGKPAAAAGAGAGAGAGGAGAAASAADSKSAPLVVALPAALGTGALAATVAAHSNVPRASAKFDLRRRSKAPAKNKPAVVGILSGMKAQPRFGKMLEYSLECLKKLAVDEPSVEEMIDEGAIEVMLAVMKLNEKNETLMQLFNDVLKAFARNDYLAALIAERLGGNFRPWTQSLHDHVQVETHTSTLSMIGVLTAKGGSDVVQYMVDSNLVSAMAHVVSGHDKHLDLQAAAARALVQFTLTPAHTSLVVNTSAPATILKAALNNPQHTALVKAAAQLLSNCLVQQPSCASNLKRLGALDFFLSALEAHPFDDDLIGAAKRSLKCLTAQADLNLALATMQAGVRNDKGTATALSKISSLLLVEDNVDFIYKHGGVDWLLSIVQSTNAPGSAEAEANRKRMLAAGCRGILRCAQGNESRIYTVLAKGGVQLLIAVLENHAHDEVVAQAALCALGALLGSRPDNGKYIAQLNGIGAVLGVLSALPESEAIARAALDFFSAMSTHVETGALLVAGHVIPATCALLGAHARNAAIALTAIQSLGRMMTSAENLQQMVKAGLLPLLVRVLKEHPDALELARAAILAIETACLLPENIPLLRSLGAVEAISNALARWPDDADLREVGLRALALLAQQAEVTKSVADAEADAARKRAEEQARLEEERRRMAEEAERMARSQMDAAAWELLQAQQLRDEEARRKAREAALAAANAANCTDSKKPKTVAKLDDLERKRLEEEMALLAMKLKESEERVRRERDEEEARRAKAAADLKAEEARRAAELKAKAEKEAALMNQPAFQELAHLRRMLAMAGGGPEAAAAVAPPKQVLAKSARALFAAEEDEGKPKVELPVWVKNFLWAGLLLKLHGGGSKARHLYLTQDLNYLVWKSPKHDISADQKMEIHRLVSVDKGLATDVLKAGTGLLGTTKLDPAKCFAVSGSDTADAKRVLSFEAHVAADAEKMVLALEKLLEYAAELKMYGRDTVTMTDNAAFTGQKKLQQKAQQMSGKKDDDDKQAKANPGNLPVAKPAPQQRDGKVDERKLSIGKVATVAVGAYFVGGVGAIALAAKYAGAVAGVAVAGALTTLTASRVKSFGATGFGLWSPDQFPQLLVDRTKVPAGHSVTRFVCLSDTHSLHDALQVPDGDVLLHAGDMTMHGTAQELRDFNAWLGKLPHKHKLVIAGNHDLLLDGDGDARVFRKLGVDPKDRGIHRARELLTNCTYVADGTAVVVNGVTVYGTPLQPTRTHTMAFNRADATLRQAFDAIPRDTDILLTHSPARGFVDRVVVGFHVGCDELKKAIERVRPRYHVCGHIHESRGVVHNPATNTTHINAANCTLLYKPTQPPIVFDFVKPLPAAGAAGVAAAGAGAAAAAGAAAPTAAAAGAGAGASAALAAAANVLRSPPGKHDA